MRADATPQPRPGDNDRLALLRPYGTGLATTLCGKGLSMRLLILDGSRILASLVRRLVPEEIEIEEVATFDEAMTCLREDPPDAVIADLGRADLPWGQLKSYCQEHRPKIPVLFESAIYGTSEEAGIGNLNHSASFLIKPSHLVDLKTQIQRLVEKVRRQPERRHVQEAQPNRTDH
jgi:DNA-binding NtrC family response regulator